MSVKYGFRWLLLPCIGLLLAACQSSGGGGGGGSTETTPITLASLEGTWAGTMVSNYLCEGSASSVEISISGGTISITGSDGNSFQIDDAGTISQTDGQSFAVVMNLDGGAAGRFYVDAEANYAVWANSSSNNSGYGYVGLLQKTAAQTISYSDTDVVGAWSGVALRLDNSLAVTNASTSTATVTNSGALALSGTDGDGAFSASATGLGLYDASLGTWLSGDGSTNSVDWSEETLRAIYTMSYDKTRLGIGFFTSLCSSSIFTNMPSQKFAFWERQ